LSWPSLTFGCLLDREPQSKLRYTSIAAEFGLPIANHF
jgi:hypothetical protein